MNNFSPKYFNPFEIVEALNSNKIQDRLKLGQFYYDFKLEYKSFFIV